VREKSKEAVLAFLYSKVGRWDSVWWNGELIPIGEALGRADELLPSERALCSHNEVILPRQLAGDNPPGESLSRTG
jgi:hypothetical protein